MDTNNMAWPPALHDSIARLSGAYMQMFRREGHARLRAEFPEMGSKELARVIDDAARRSWEAFERDDLARILDELRRS